MGHLIRPRIVYLQNINLKLMEFICFQARLPPIAPRERIESSSLIYDALIGLWSQPQLECLPARNCLCVESEIREIFCVYRYMEEVSSNRLIQ